MDLTTQKGVLKRSRYLIDLGVQSGDRLFDGESGLLRQRHPTHPSYTGVVVAQTPLEYAIALFETGTNLERANQVIRRTAGFQDRNPASPTYGNFIWMTHWEAVHDRNAVSFMTPNYAYLWRKHAASLEPATRRCLETVFPLALRGVRAHRVPAAYTNIFLLNILSKLELAAILGDATARDEALVDWQAWVEEVSQHGIVEYNSPCYTAVDLYALEGILDAAPDEGFRRQVERLLEYVWTEFAANYHPGAKCLTGPMSRAYPSDYLYGNGLSAVIACQQFGLETASFDSNGGLTPFVVNFGIRHYVVPERIRQAALGKSAPVTVRGSVPSRGIVWENYLAPDFALGSQTGYYGGQEMPVFLAFRTRRKRRTVFFMSNPAAAVLASAQHQGMLLGGFTFPADLDWSRHGDGARESASVCLRLGLGKDLRGRVFPQDVFAQRRTAPAAPAQPAVQALAEPRVTQASSLCGRRQDACATLDAKDSASAALDYGSVFVGVKAFLVGPAGEKTPALPESCDGELQIRWPLGQWLDAGPGDRPPVAGFLLVVDAAERYAGIEEFAGCLDAHTITLTAESHGFTLSMSGGDHRLSVDVPPRQPPAASFLHDSPYLHLRPGELA